MNACADHIVGYLFAQSWQIAILAGIAGLLSLALRNRSAHIRYLLWLIVLAKCLVPPLVTVPLAVLPEDDSAPPIGNFVLPIEHPPSEVPALPGEGVEPAAEPVPVMLGALSWATLVWIAGATVFLLWVGGRAVRYTSWLRVRRRPLPPALAEPLRELSDLFKFKRLPRIWLLEDVGQPFVWGVFRGSVYLPAGFVAVGESDQRRSIVAHEFSHIARCDAGVNLIQVLAQAVYWFHPLVWWANRKIRQEREKCCDEMAVARLDARPEHYTGAIVDTLAAERRSAHPIPSLAIVGSVKDIEERIKTMLRPGKTFRTRPSLVAATIALLIALVTIPTALVLTARGQTQPPSQSAGQPAIDSEKPEQPRYAARTFNSELALYVSVRETDTGGWRPVGDTPRTVPLQIPACWAWQVYPRAPVKDWSLLARVMSQNKIPGLVLASCTDSDLKYLADLRDLRLLALWNTSITDAGLEHLRGLTGLEELSLGRTRITDAGLACLDGMTGLRGLYLNMARVTDAGLEHIKGLTGLRDLSLGGTRITDAGLIHLKDLTGLRYLGLENTQVTDAGLEHLKGLTGLQSLALNTTRVTGQGLVHLKALTNLEDLSLESGRITDANLAYLDGLPWLRRLGLSGRQITDAGLTHVRNLTGLHRLSLRNTRITDAGLESLKGLTGLQQLGLEQTQITDTGLEYLGDLQGLQRLWLDNTGIGDAGLEHLTGLTGLQQLSLQGTQITDAGLEHLQGLNDLRRLWLDNTRIGDAGLEHLRGLTELVMLQAPGTQITDAGLERLKGLTKLEGLYLPRTQITDAGLKHLQGLTELRNLGVIETQVTDAGARQLKQHLPNLTVWTVQTQLAAQGTDELAQPISADATPVFTDSFDNGPSDQWRFRDTKTTLPGPGYSVENGQLRLSSTRAYLDSIDLANYTVRARVCIKDVVPNSQGSFGIAVRRTPSPFRRASLQERYGLSLICGNPGCLWLAFAYYDVSGPLQQQVLGFASCRVVQGQWYTLEFEVRGEDLRVYLDGKLMVEATDERLTKGPIHIVGGNATVLIDEFSVYGLP